MRLADLRKKKGLTQESLALSVGTRRVNIARYESGERRPPPDIAERLADALGLTIEEMWNLFYSTKPETA